MHRGHTWASKPAPNLPSGGLFARAASRVISVAAAATGSGSAAALLRGPLHARRPEARICPVCRTHQGRSHCVLRGGAQIRVRCAQDRADRRPGRPGGWRPIGSRQECLGPRPGGAVWPRRRASGRDRRRQGTRPQGAGFVKLGGIAMGKIPRRRLRRDHHRRSAGRGVKPERVADIALGVELRAYSFDRYKTKRKDGEERRPRSRSRSRSRVPPRSRRHSPRAMP